MRQVLRRVIFLGIKVKSVQKYLRDKEEKKIIDLVKKHTKEWKDNQSKRYLGSKNHNWKGGIPKCIICNKEISYRTKTNCCKKCYHKIIPQKKGKEAPNWKGGTQRGRHKGEYGGDENRTRIT